MEVEGVGGRAELLACASEDWKEFVDLSLVMPSMVSSIGGGMILVCEGMMMASLLQVADRQAGRMKHRDNGVQGKTLEKLECGSIDTSCDRRESVIISLANQKAC